MSNVTMKMIAQQAGVTRQTVSKILNKKDTMVSQDTRDKVLRLVKEMNYQPNYFAKSLRTGKTGCIGLMGSRHMFYSGYYCYAKTTESIEETLGNLETPYSLLTFAANTPEIFNRSLDLIRKGLVDGLIMILLAEELKDFDKTVLPKLQETNLPFVAIHSVSSQMEYNNVGTDCYYGGYCAARHLITLGHRDIRFYMRQYGDPQIREILEGFKKAFADNGLAWTDENLLYPSVKADTLMEMISQTMEKLSRPPTALFLPGDSDAYGTLEVCKRKGIRVPEDLAVIGFDDERPATYFKTDLTTVYHPFKEKGIEAVNMLMEIMDGTRNPAGIHQKIVKPHLVIRKTCGANKGKEKDADR